MSSSPSHDQKAFPCNSLIFFFFKIYSNFSWKPQRKREQSSLLWFPYQMAVKSTARLGLSQGHINMWFSYVVFRDPRSWAINCCFLPSVLVGSLTRSEGARIQIMHIDKVWVSPVMTQQLSKCFLSLLNLCLHVYPSIAPCVVPTHVTLIAEVQKCKFLSSLML